MDIGYKIGERTQYIFKAGCFKLHRTKYKTLKYLIEILLYSSRTKTISEASILDIVKI